MEFLFNFFNELYSNLNYITIFILMALESSVFPVPSELVMIPAGYLAFEGHLSLFWVILAGGLGSLFWATINYYILGKYLGKPFLLKYGKFFFIKEKKYLEAEKLFLKNSHLYTFIGRFIPVIRHFISIPAGMFSMKFSQFALLTMIGATIWCAILALVGYYFWDGMVKIFHTYTHEISLWVIGIAAIWWIYFLFKKEK